MKKNILLVLMVVQIFLLSGCVFITIPLRPGVTELEEKTIYGEGKSKFLLIDISGTISNKEKTGLLGTSQELNIVARVKEELEKAEKDKAIKGLILMINSPGGEVAATDNIYHEIIKFKEKKKVGVIACLNEVAASGGYYIAASADKLIAYPTVITGSIGVITLRFDITGLMDKVGVKEVSIKTGENKDITSIFKELTPEEQKILQGIIDNLYNRFLSIVIESRAKLSPKDIDVIKDGRIFTAEEALKMGLVDRIGYFEDAVDLFKEETGLKKVRVVIYKRPYAYKPNVYSTSTSFLAPSAQVNAQPALININLQGVLDEICATRFMYMWKP
ncbi:MAG: signal peptide peptidase SppA [bacterium]